VDPDVALREALVRGLRDFVADSGLPRVVIGLSGGIDSAVVACLAVEALGAEAVTAVFLPSAFTSDESREGAIETARRLGIEWVEISIEPLHRLAREAMPQTPEGVPDENLQARLRAVVLMTMSNQRHSLVVCPGNRSEIAMGYSTLYGDTVGAVAPLADLYKGEVYRLAEQFSRKIPQRVRDRAPTAELRPGQRDDQDLPAYPVLDPILTALLDEGLGRSELIGRGFDPMVVDQVLERYRAGAHKRGQLPPAIRVR
jgi:NAD+ synthase (glutamine-hydrolysing)